MCLLRGHRKVNAWLSGHHATVADSTFKFVLSEIWANNIFFLLYSQNLWELSLKNERIQKNKPHPHPNPSLCRFCILHSYNSFNMHLLLEAQRCSFPVLVSLINVQHGKVEETTPYCSLFLLSIVIFVSKLGFRRSKKSFSSTFREQRSHSSWYVVY